jgi:hypothetical protein
VFSHTREQPPPEHRSCLLYSGSFPRCGVPHSGHEGYEVSLGHLQSDCVCKRERERERERVREKERDLVVVIICECLCVVWSAAS